MTDNPTIATYDRVAGEYAARNFGMTRDDRSLRFAKAISQQAPPERFRVLDAGCGPGRDSKWFHERGFQVTGVDLSAGMLVEARRRAPGVDFHQADLRKLDFPAGSFDGVWCCASLLHVPRADVPGVLASFRLLLDHGYLYLAVKAGQGEEVEERGYGPGNPRFFTYFTRHEIELSVERAGFEVREVWEDGPTPNARNGWVAILAQTGLRQPLLGAMAIVFDDQGRVLLSERADGRGWNLPAGFVDAGEGPDEAAVREAREETGLVVEIDRLVGVYTRSRLHHGENWSLISHAFLCRVVGGALTLTNESLQHGWFAPDALPEPMSSRHHVEILQDARAMRAGTLAVPVVRRL
ncbi:MAG TPA: NUDIX domain-containing protein [Chloroflexota bacterium]|nr:NUDIX domain-containing protein [Chloroflexota bacterium]